jgi:NADPH-dependent 2,4-dienoyl-CoA reductase/sulfur reductase-like enzyme
VSGGTLVVGASQAGAQLAASLREAGDTAPITLVGSEPHHPYQRPPLSKGYLLGRTDAAALSLRSSTYYADRDIEVRTGERVTELSAGVARTDTGRTLAFDRLALTVGARVRRLTVPGAELPGVHHLRDLADAERLRAALPGAERVVVVGGGFVGLEAAAVARTLGAEVTVVEMGPRLVGRSVAPVVSEFYRQAHERRGVTVLLDAAVTAVQGRRGAVSAVVLADGTEVPADLVLVGIGVAPRTELADELGLACAGGSPGGILVDDDARRRGRGLRRASRAGRADPARVGAERDLPGEDRRRDAGRPAATGRRGAVVLVGPGRPEAPDRRPVRRPRRGGRARRRRRGAVRCAPLPRRRARRRRRRQLPRRLPGRPQGSGEGPHHSRGHGG